MPAQSRQVERSRNHASRTSAKDVVLTAGDRLYRTASECLRQRERYGRLVGSGAPELEQQAALRVACLCDDILRDSLRSYEIAVGGDATVAGDDRRRASNALWHACREYGRRHNNCEESSRRLGQRRTDKLKELAMAFDLEASALLALRLALASYRKVRPECELDDRRQSSVA